MPTTRPAPPRSHPALIAASRNGQPRTCRRSLFPTASIPHRANDAVTPNSLSPSVEPSGESTSGFGDTEPLPSHILVQAAQLIDQRAIRILFHPLVHLADSEPVGFEALARGPEHSPIESPQMLLRAAEQLGRLDELDWLCAAAAARAVKEARQHPSMSIFLNFKASTVLSDPPPDLLADITWAKGQLRVVAEIDEADITQRPGQVLEAAGRLRQDGWGIAADNIGSAPLSLALLPVMQPDVVKINCTELAGRVDATAAEIEEAVRTYAEESGAVILAQRIETDPDLLLAHSFGATYAQGWRYGHPRPLTTNPHPPRAPFPLIGSKTPDLTPFELIKRHHPATPIEKRHLLRLSRVLETRAQTNGAPTIALGCVQDEHRLTSDLAQRYITVAANTVYAALFASSLNNIALPGVHLVDTSAYSALHDQWNVIVISPNYSAALVARDHGATPDHGYEPYDYILTHDRALVAAAARATLRWISPQKSTRTSPL